VIDRFEYLPASQSICVTVSDDTALAFDSDVFSSPFRLIIDGKEHRAGASSQPIVDYDAVSYTKNVGISDVPSGPHSAKVIVRDAAGNETVAELVFDSSAVEKFTIALEGGAVDKEGLFVAVGELPAEADIVILDSNGMLVNRDRFPAEGYRWDATDLSGLKVPPGLYKAYIIETGSHNGKGHSALINVPVI
ncbi:MAG: hypothetical protein K2J15_06260, partial [Muribaculaceae bacterium]|nr:hypothetical protein [Muribaculaceae bacterium]